MKKSEKCKLHTNKDSEFFYNYVYLPEDRNLLMNINLAAYKLSIKLKNLNINLLEISDYNRRYLGDYAKDLRKTLQNYTYILYWSLISTNCQFEKVVFLEYGGGSGILSLLAKELKIDTVIYNDIYDISCKDAKVIGESIGNQADYYVNGDIDDIICFLRKNHIYCNTIASRDVIEHIYDVEDFLKKLGELSDGSLCLSMSSGANVMNPFIERYLIKKQIEFEYKDRKKKFGHKERDCLIAYLKVRKRMIAEYSPNLTNKEIEKLSILTRGMIELDIMKCIDEYLKTGLFPQNPSHHTNTCDPNTGNWTEHLMNFNHIRDILLKSGFEVDILSGYWSCPKNNIKKRFLYNFLNIIIGCFGKQGIRIAPFFVIYGKKI